MSDFSDFTDDDIEMAIELGRLVREDGQRETREFIRAAVTGCDDCGGENDG